ncbi:MAG: UbiD family decarboxylase [Fuerstiella sp.]|nr:UbiD family decarboxylase [Fuerstiella sp.]MCP4510970.1 UbiD family decarboxylase [Fuerstiella sp.]
MGYRNLQQCVRDLERRRMLVRVSEEIDADLEAAEIHRRVYAAGGPALLFDNVRNCRFPMVSNLFGTMDRTRFMFRDALAGVQALIRLKKDPAELLRHPSNAPAVLRTLFSMRPAKRSTGPVLAHETSLDQLPALKSWPEDGGAFITLPEVYTEHPERPGYLHSNLGMYRVQISGNQYASNRQVGLHYQIHRSIGLHHAAALAQGEPLRVNIFVGGPPSMAVAAVMPLPEGIPEVAFAGALSRHAIRMIRQGDGPMICSEADFCITGTIAPEELPEGPFGDHLGYYSLTHDFPVLNVEHVYHRENAIWPFTVVGRPPQEDTSFGELIHELTGPAIPAVLPGVHAVHAVDESGVHPLLLAIGNERYVPYAEERQPQELLTNANAILGQGQLSLAKYLLITAYQDNPGLDINDIEAFLRHVLERVDWTRDLHFQTRTTIDTLDYTGTGLNKGSKLVIAAAGRVQRELPSQVPADLWLPDGFENPRVCLPGVIAIAAPGWSVAPHQTDPAAERFSRQILVDSVLNRFPLVVLTEDSEFCARSLSNFLWVTFTRSNPAADIHGVADFTEQKHWGCHGSLIIDARIKPHMAPALESDPDVSKRVDQLFARGGTLHGIC